MILKKLIVINYVIYTIFQVFVDVMIHFGRRGRENLRNFERDGFAVTRDGDGSLYVYKVKDELTKNHQTDDTRTEGRMYEIKGNSN